MIPSELLLVEFFDLDVSLKDREVLVESGLSTFPNL